MSEADKFVTIGSTRNAAQTFTSPSDFSAITEAWFEVGQGLGAALTGSEAVELMFWENTSAESWIGLPNAPTTPTLIAATYAISPGTVNYPATTDIPAGTWLQLSLNTNDQTAVGALATGKEYGFSLYQSGLPLNLSRHTDTTATGYNLGAAMNVNNGIDPTISVSRDANFYIIRTV